MSKYSPSQLQKAIGNLLAIVVLIILCIPLHGYASVDRSWYRCECPPQIIHTPYAKSVLEFVLINGRLANPSELQAVRVFRRGVPISVQPNMLLCSQDTIITSPEAVAVLWFFDGSHVAIFPNTQYRITNSGKVEKKGVIYYITSFFARNRQGSRQSSEYMTASSPSTEFFVIVQEGSLYDYYGSEKVFVPVLEGSVTITSNYNLWAPIVVRNFEQAVVDGPNIPVKNPITSEELDYLGRLIEPIRRRIPTPWPIPNDPRARVVQGPVVVPDVTKVPLRNAATILYSRGLQVGRVTFTNAHGSPPQQSVVCQSLWPGTVVQIGTSIDLQVSR